MEVMDLSLPKTHEVPRYSPPLYSALQQEQQQLHYMLHQSQYLLQQQPRLLQIQPQLQYKTSQSINPVTTQPSINHLGFFQQLQYNNLPQVVPTLLPSPVSNTSPVKFDPTPTPVCENDKDKESTRSKENIRPHAAVKRPFKLIASAKSPTSLALPSMIDPNSSEAYEEYRNKVLSQIIKGESEPNRNMRRTIPSNPEKCNDPEYLERRRKNNEAAKKSREARKAKEDEIAIRVSFLEQENLKLKFQLAAIERQKKMYLLRLEQQQKVLNSTACF